MKKKQNIITTTILEEMLVLKSTSHKEQITQYLQPHSIELCCLWIIRKGCARISINLSEYTITPCNLVMILPNNIIQITKVTEDFSSDIIAFSPHYIQNIELAHQIVSNMETISIKPVIALSSEESLFINELYSTFSRIYNHSKLQPNINHGLLKSLLMVFFYVVCSIYSNNRIIGNSIKQSRKEEIVHNYLQLVFKHCNKERSVGWYASKLCITPSYLNASVKKVKGISASKIISNVIILFAKSKLKSSSDTIQEISDSLNFPNASFFTKFFKRETGLSPSDYRNQSILGGEV